MGYKLLPAMLVDLFCGCLRLSLVALDPTAMLESRLKQETYIIRNARLPFHRDRFPRRNETYLHVAKSEGTTRHVWTKKAVSKNDDQHENCVYLDSFPPCEFAISIGSKINESVLKGSNCRIMFSGWFQWFLFEIPIQRALDDASTMGRR